MRYLILKIASELTKMVFHLSKLVMGMAGTCPYMICSWWLLINLIFVGA